MPDKISDEERAAINAALHTDKHQHIPQGQSAWRLIEGVSVAPGMHETVKRRVWQVIERRRAIRDMLPHTDEKEIRAHWPDVAKSTISKDIDFVMASMGQDNEQRRRENIARTRREKQASRPVSSRQSTRAKATEERRARVRELHAQGKVMAHIQDELSTSWATVRNDLEVMGLTPHPGKTGRKVTKGPRSTAENPQDRRRFKETIPPTGRSNSMAPASSTGTLFQNRVFEPPDHPLLDGKHQRKLGGDVLVGRLRGYRLLHLSLEERRTCPRSCHHWQDCYGNNMQFAKRFRHGQKLEINIEQQIDFLMLAPRGVLVRLHTLGDFYSVDYVGLWGRLLDKYEKLSCFGFTAHAPDTEIGAAVAMVREEFGNRFAIRHSGLDLEEWGSITMEGLADPGQTTTGKNATICPEQRHALEGRDSNLHCGSCGLCWKGGTTIAFMRH